MTINYDEKGKIFTDIVPKEPIPVRVQTTKQFLTGEIHVRIGYRLKDELDLDEPFLAITNAVVFDTEDKILFQTKFMAIRRDQVVWITADDEMKKEDDYVK
jgi:hypothetical protein